jgi:hypothetical protein
MGAARVGVRMMMVIVGLIVTGRMMIDVPPFVRALCVPACFGAPRIFRGGKRVRHLARMIHGDKSRGTVP